jgi:hypothetical protein
MFFHMSDQYKEEMYVTLQLYQIHTACHRILSGIFQKTFARDITVNPLSYADE